MDPEQGNVISLWGENEPHHDIDGMKNFVEAELPTEAKRCFHTSVLVSEFERKLTCRLCRKVLDPFEYILSIAKKETHLDWELRALRNEIKQRRSGLENLKREELNTRSRIKTAQFRLNDLNMALLQAGDQIVKVKGLK